MPRTKDKAPWEKLIDITSKLAKTFSKYKKGSFMAVKFIIILIIFWFIIKSIVEKFLEICSEPKYYILFLSIFGIISIIILSVFSKEDRKLITTRLKPLPKPKYEPITIEIRKFETTNLLSLDYIESDR